MRKVLLGSFALLISLSFSPSLFAQKGARPPAQQRAQASDHGSQSQGFNNSRATETKSVTVTPAPQHTMVPNHINEPAAAQVEERAAFGGGRGGIGGGGGRGPAVALAVAVLDAAVLVAVVRRPFPHLLRSLPNLLAVTVVAATAVVALLILRNLPTLPAMAVAGSWRWQRSWRFQR